MTFLKEYNIDILRDSLSFKKYKVLLNTLSSKSDLMNIITLRAMNDSEIKDKKLLKYKKSIELKQNKNEEDPLKQMALMLKGEN